MNADNVWEESYQAAVSKATVRSCQIGSTQQRPQSMLDFTNCRQTTEVRLRKGKLSAMRLLV
jgi:hypothetical protein